MFHLSLVPHRYLVCHSPHIGTWFVNYPTSVPDLSHPLLIGVWFVTRPTSVLDLSLNPHRYLVCLPSQIPAGWEGWTGRKWTEDCGQRRSSGGHSPALPPRCTSKTTVDPVTAERLFRNSCSHHYDCVGFEMKLPEESRNALLVSAQRYFEKHFHYILLFLLAVHRMIVRKYIF